MDSTCFSGASLLGLAISAARDGSQEGTLEYIRAAAQASSLAAKALHSQVSRACSSGLSPSSNEREHQERVWLLEAGASGSLPALWQLRQISSSLEQQAWEDFRKNGGFSGSMSPIGISPRIPSLQGKNAVMQLHKAAIFGTGDDISKFASPFNIDEVDDEGQTALYKAARAGNLETLKALIELNADASITTAVAHISCLHWLFMFDSGSVESVVHMLRSRFACLSARTNVPRKGIRQRHVLSEHFPFHWPIGAPFHWACFTRSFPSMQALLRNGVDVDELDLETGDEAQTPLGMAMYRGDAEVVGFLLQCGANPNRVDGLGRNPMHMLALSTSSNRLLELPKCLYWWCIHGAQETHIELVAKCVNLVVAAGGNINARRGSSQHGTTPLLDAIASNDGGVTLALLKAGADAFLCDELETSPLHHWASLEGRRLIYPDTWEPVFCLLMDLSPEAHATDYLGEGVLHRAVSNPSFHHFRRAMEILLESPLRKQVTHRNDHGYSLLKSVLLRKITGGRDVEPRFGFLLDYDGAVKLEEEDIGDLIWTTCRNETLSDQTCLRIIKRLFDCKESVSHIDLISKLYGNEPGILAGSKGTNILMAAIWNVHLETVKFLLRPTIDLQIVSMSGLSILDYALSRAELLRRTGLERWSSHGPAEEPPKHRGHKNNRDPNSFRELFWAEQILSNELGESIRSMVGLFNDKAI